VADVRRVHVFDGGRLPARARETGRGPVASGRGGRRGGVGGRVVLTDRQPAGVLLFDRSGECVIEVAGGVSRPPPARESPSAGNLRLDLAAGRIEMQIAAIAPGG
jgi:hypothetical protein